MIVHRRLAHIALMTKVSHTPARCTWINTVEFPSTMHWQCLQRHLPIVRRHIEKHKEQRNIWADSQVRKTSPWVLPIALWYIPAPKTKLPLGLYGNTTWHLSYVGFCLLIKGDDFLSIKTQLFPIPFFICFYRNQTENAQTMTSPQGPLLRMYLCLTWVCHGQT